MDALAELRLQIEWGADEALMEEPVNRLAPPPAVSPPVSAALAGNPLVATAATGSGAGPGPGTAARAKHLADAFETVEALRDCLAGFEGCALRHTASHFLPAEGNAGAGLVFISDMPSAEDDRAGRIFADAAGRLFDQMIGSIGLDRDQCLILNVIPWRPPGDRAPNPGELAVCVPFLHRTLALLAPRMVAPLGGLATQAATGREGGIRRMRGRWLDAPLEGLPRSMRMLPMLHPTYLRHAPGAKREAWQDLLRLRAALDQS